MADAEPTPETATDEVLSAEIEAGWVGRVRISYRRQLVRHRKHSHWFWAGFCAEALG